jgi:hypothetical protein
VISDGNPIMKKRAEIPANDSGHSAMWFYNSRGAGCQTTRHQFRR